MGAVAHHQPAPVGIALVGEPSDTIIDLGLQRLGEHPPGALTDEVIDQSQATRPAGVVLAGSSSNYGEHGSYLPDRRWRAGLT